MLFPVVGPGRAVRALGSWSPDEVVYVKYLDGDVKRLTCFEDRGFCRYYLGLEESQKPEAFMYFPFWLLELVEKYKSQTPGDTITKYAKEKDILRPRYVGVFATGQIRRFFRRAGRSGVI